MQTGTVMRKCNMHAVYACVADWRQIEVTATATANVDVMVLY